MSILRIQTYESPAAFTDTFTTRWLDNEAEDAAFLRIAGHAGSRDMVCLAVIGDDDVVLQTACLYTGDQLIMQRAEPATLAHLAEHLHAHCHEVQGVFAPNPASLRFMRAYTGLTGGRFEVVKRLTHFALSTLEDSRPCPGAFRAARAEDQGLIAAFRDASQREGNTQRPYDSARSVARDMDAGGLYVWEDEAGQVVCAAAIDLSRSPRSAHIDDVYTPPEHRLQGFASALVHALSAIIIRRGLTARLSTDMTNAPANKVYTNLGYVPICQMDNVRIRKQTPTPAP